MGLIERWKIFDNLRRSLVGPALVLALVLSWLLPSFLGQPLVWSLLGLITIGLPLVLHVLGGLLHAATGGGIAALRGIRESLLGTAAQCGLALSFLLHQSLLALHALGVTLKRLFFTRKDLLEWETAAAAEQRLGDDLPSFFRHMGVATGLAGIFLIMVLVLEPAVAVGPQRHSYSLGWQDLS